MNSRHIKNREDILEEVTKENVEECPRDAGEYGRISAQVLPHTKSETKMDESESKLRI